MNIPLIKYIDIDIVGLLTIDKLITVGIPRSFIDVIFVDRILQCTFSPLISPSKYPQLLESWGFQVSSLSTHELMLKVSANAPIIEAKQVNCFIAKELQLKYLVSQFVIMLAALFHHIGLTG